MGILLVKQDVATCPSLSFLLQENGHLLFLLHFCLPREMSLVAEKRNYKQILYHLVSGRASPFPSKRGTQSLGMLICMHSRKKQLLSYLPLSLQSYLVKFMPFSYASLLVFADIYEISIVCHSQIMCA